MGELSIRDAQMLAESKFVVEIEKKMYGKSKLMADTCGLERPNLTEDEQPSYTVGCIPYDIRSITVVDKNDPQCKSAPIKVGVSVGPEAIYVSSTIWADCNFKNGSDCISRDFRGPSACIFDDGLVKKAKTVLGAKEPQTANDSGTDILQQ